MSLFSVLKNNAKLALKGNWGKAIVAFLVTAGASLILGAMRGAVVDIFIDPADLDPTFAIYYGINSYFLQRFAMATLKETLIFAAFALAGLALVAPLSVGVYRFHYQLVLGNRPALSEIFRYFETAKGYRRSLWYEFQMLVRVFLWSVVFFVIPGGILAASVMVGAMGPAIDRSMLALASVGMLLSGVLFLLAAVFFAVVINRYALTAYLLCENDDTSVKEAFANSIAYTKGYRFSLLWYELSFIGWFLLCALVFPVLYVAPYVHTSFAMYGRYIIEKNRFAPPDPTREFDRGSGPVPQVEPSASSGFEGVDPSGPEQADSPPPDVGAPHHDDGFTFPPSRYGDGPDSPPTPAEGPDEQGATE